MILCNDVMFLNVRVTVSFSPNLTISRSQGIGEALILLYHWFKPHEKSSNREALIDSESICRRDDQRNNDWPACKNVKHKVTSDGEHWLK